MKRTTISLPDSLAESLEREASRRQTSASEIVRSALVEHLGLNRPREIPFAGIGRSGRSDLSESVDEMLAADWADYIERDAFGRG